MLKGKRKYFSLKELMKDYHEEDYVVQKAERNCRFYLKFDSCRSFFYWYSSFEESQKTFSEVIMSGPQKLKIDIDYRCKNMSEVLDCVKDVLASFGLKRPNIIVYDIEKTYHLVISNYFFASNVHCRYVASKIKERVDIDMSVYSTVQHFRTEGSTKHGELRWKRRMSSPLTSSSFSEGAISCLQGCEYFELSVSKYAVKARGSSEMLNPMEHFRIREVRGDMILLDRISSSFCKICDRVHDKENAYMVRDRFFCRRDG